VADEFIRVRLTRIDEADLSLFEFDYDLTMMVFFLSPAGRVYARYGGRDGRDADSRQSLEGLAFTMRSVLAMHAAQSPAFAPASNFSPFTIRDVAGRRGGGCFHCHQVKETLNHKLTAEGRWSRDRLWRYPLPENLGFRLEVDRGNVVEKVQPGSPAERAGLAPGDQLVELGGVPVHSLGDAQFALDRAPAAGRLDVAWLRSGEARSSSIELAESWKKSDLRWRASMRRWIPGLPLAGKDLEAVEREALGLSPTQLAFRQDDRVSPRAKEAGIQPGDVIIDLDGRKIELKANALRSYVAREYIQGDTVIVSLLRDGERMQRTLVLGAPR
jgi:hypothetical protein